MVLGVVCGLRKEYTTLGKWLKALVRSTSIWFLTPTCNYTATGRAISPIRYTWNVPCIFSLRSYMFKNWCFLNKLLPEYSVYNLFSLCVLLDNICFAEHWPMQREWICSFADKPLKFMLKTKDNLYTHTLCVFVTRQELFEGISGFI